MHTFERTNSTTENTKSLSLGDLGFDFASSRDECPIKFKLFEYISETGTFIEFKGNEISIDPNTGLITIYNSDPFEF